MECLQSPLTVDGRPLTLSIILDITDKRLALEELKRSQARIEEMRELDALRDWKLSA